MLYLSYKGGAGKPPLPSEEELVQRSGLLRPTPLLAQFDTNGALDLFLLHNRACKTEMKAGKYLYVHVTVLAQEPPKGLKSDLAHLSKESFS